MSRPESTAEEITKWRSMTGQERLMEAERLFWEARSKIEREVRPEHPDWGKEETQWEIYRRLQALDE